MNPFEERVVDESARRDRGPAFEPERADAGGSTALDASYPPAREWTSAMKIGATLVLLWFLCLLAAGMVIGLTHDFSARVFKDTILAWGGWGVAVSIGLMVAHSLVPFPAELLALANGSIYGPLWGTVITWVGAMLGALLAFAISRVLGRPFLVLIVTETKLRTVDEWAENCGVYAIFFSRFVPLIAFNVINYAAGLSRVSWWTFTWATGVGILPLVALMVLIGHQAEALTWELGLLLLVCVFLVGCLFRRGITVIRERTGAARTTLRWNPPRSSR